MAIECNVVILVILVILVIYQFNQQDRSDTYTGWYHVARFSNQISFRAND